MNKNDPLICPSITNPVVLFPSFLLSWRSRARLSPSPASNLSPRRGWGLRPLAPTPPVYSGVAVITITGRSSPKDWSFAASAYLVVVFSLNPVRATPPHLTGAQLPERRRLYLPVREWVGYLFATTFSAGRRRRPTTLVAGVAPLLPLGTLYPGNGRASPLNATLGFATV